MTNKTIPADKVREIATAMRAAMRRDELAYSYGEFLGDMSDYITALEALLPKLPTLADMTHVARRECRWMQCEVDGEDGEWLIIDPFDDESHAHVIGREGYDRVLPTHSVIPRPDLARMEWTSSKKPAPSLPEGWRLADHETYGRVIVTSTAPDADGDVCFVAPVPGIIGNDWHLCDPDELRYLDQ